MCFMMFFWCFSQKKKTWPHWTPIETFTATNFKDSGIIKSTDSTFVFFQCTFTLLLMNCSEEEWASLFIYVIFSWSDDDGKARLRSSPDPRRSTTMPQTCYSHMDSSPAKWRPCTWRDGEDDTQQRRKRRRSSPCSSSSNSSRTKKHILVKRGRVMEEGSRLTTVPPCPWRWLFWWRRRLSWSACPTLQEEQPWQRTPATRSSAHSRLSTPCFPFSPPPLFSSSFSSSPAVASTVDSTLSYRPGKMRKRSADGTEKNQRQREKTCRRQVVTFHVGTPTVGKDDVGGGSTDRDET